MGLAGSVARLERVHSLRVDGLIASSQHHGRPRVDHHRDILHPDFPVLSHSIFLFLSLSSSCASLVPPLLSRAISNRLHQEPGVIGTPGKPTIQLVCAPNQASEPALINCPSLFVVPRRKVLRPSGWG